MGYAEVVLEDSPACYWRLGAASGDEVDSSGAGHTISVSGSPSSVAGLLVGDPDKARGFAGGSDSFRLTAGSPTPGGSGVMTAEAWVKQSSYAAGDMLAKWGTGGQSFTFSLDGTGHPYLYGGAPHNIISPTAITLNVANHVVGTYDGTNGRLYLNGVLVVGPLSMGRPSLTTSPALTIGNEDSGGSALVGTIDEVAFYQTALSAGRTLAHYTEGALRGGVRY